MCTFTFRVLNEAVSGSSALENYFPSSSISLLAGGCTTLQIAVIQPPCSVVALLQINPCTMVFSTHLFTLLMRFVLCVLYNIQ